MVLVARQDVAAWDRRRDSIPPSTWDTVSLPKLIETKAQPLTPFEIQSKSAVKIQAQARGHLYRQHVWREKEYNKKQMAEKALYRKAPPLVVHTALPMASSLFIVYSVACVCINEKTTK